MSDGNVIDEAAIDAALDEARAAADELARILAELRDGVAAIDAARIAAEGDIATAEALRSGALDLKALATTLAGQARAFVPKAVYTPGDLSTIAAAVATIADRQALIADGVAGMAAWRAGVDRNAVLTDRSLAYLAGLAARQLDPS